MGPVAIIHGLATASQEVFYLSFWEWSYAGPKKRTAKPFITGNILRKYNIQTGVFSIKSLSVILAEMS